MSSTNMGLPIPTVGTTIGPDWASNNNSCFTIIDAHDHTNGNGVAITPSGININADLAFNGNSLNTLLKASFTSQSAAITGTNFLSFVSGNLYVNDGSGNQIPITSAGGVAGSPGSIGSLAAPASATYSAGSKLFSWRADSGKAAAMDNGAVTIRETNVASAKGITLASPAALAADYQLTLLTGLPASTQAVTCDASGNLSTITYDNIGVAMTATGANAIAATMTSTGANAVAASRTRATGTAVAAGGVAISNDISFITSSATFVDVTNATVTITTSGRPVVICLTSDSTSSTPNSNSSYINVTGAVGPLAVAVNVVRGSSVVGHQSFVGHTSVFFPSSSFNQIDTPAAGTYTYKLQIATTTGGNAQITFSKLVAYEL